MQAFIISSNADEKDFLAFALRRAGLAVATSSGLERVLSNWEDHPADLLVLSASQIEGVSEKIERTRTVTPAMLIVVVDPPTEDALCGLVEAGADLVLERPVSSRVLAAYSQSMARRSRGVPGFVLPVLDLPEISLDPSTRTVSVAGKDPTRLTQLEFRLLYTLMSNRGHVIPTEVIVERVWGYTGESNRDLVRGLVSRLRRKVESDPEEPRFIETISGVGYRFEVDEG